MGVDAWWMDATEPSFRDGFTQLKQEEKTKSAGNTYLGSFHRYLNTYSLEMLKDFYQRLRAESDQKRIFILTRSAFASQQHYGTAVWSGDVSASWENMHKQLVAGLNLSMSGIPYWTSDTGGFFVTERDAKYPDLSLIHISEPTRRTPISYAVFCLKKKKKKQTKKIDSCSVDKNHKQ